MITCIALDDEPLALEVIASFCARVPELNLVRTFTNAREAKEYLANYPVELIFLDIQMPDINGIDFYKGLDHAPHLILTTAFPEYAVEGFNINADDFLLKPVSFSRFDQAIKKVQESLAGSRQNPVPENRYLLVRSEYSLVKIPFDEILFIETLDDYIKIHQANKKLILTIMSLKKVLEKLPADTFVRVHRSFVVPLHRITAVRGKTVFIDDQEIPIGKNYEKEFLEMYQRGGR